MALKPKAGNSGEGTIHLSEAVGVSVVSCLSMLQVLTSTQMGKKCLGQPTLPPAYSGILERGFQAVQTILGR